MKNDNSLNSLDRSTSVLKKSGDPDSQLVDASPQLLLDFMWELTAEIYSLNGNFDAQQRLQRNVTNLIRP
jgi:hypothetical protein